MPNLRRTLKPPVPLKARVLIVDDDERNAFAASEALEVLGHELVVARSGEEALRLLLVQEFAVILLDLHMPGMDGYETIREIRSIGRFADLPIIAVTAKAMKGDRSKCIQAGASDYVSKPVDIDYLISVMRVSIQRTDAQRLADAPPPRIPADA